MTKVVFETATFADAVKKAARIAPTKGSAFDKAAGIVISVSGEHGLVVVKATNLSIFSMEWVSALSVEGNDTSWRLPSAQLATWVATLPIGTGKNITLEEVTSGHNKFLQLTADRKKAKFNLMTVDYYPEWEVFSPDGLVEVEDFGGRIGLVEWAASKDEVPLNGVNFNGERVLACDRYRLATSPLHITGLAESITVPAGILSSILKQTGEVRLGVSEAGHLLIMPDDTTQLMVVVFGNEYPRVDPIMKRDRPAVVKLNKEATLEMMNRANAFAGSNRFPLLRVFLHQEEFSVMMNTAEIGVMADTMEVPGFCKHPMMELKFTPKNLIEAINACPNEELNFWYDPDDVMAIVYIDGGSGYEAWVMPRKSLTPQEEEANDAAS